MRRFFLKKEETLEQANTHTAVMDLVFADSEEEIREVLTQSGSALITELSDRVFEQFLKEARGDAQLEARLGERLARVRTARKTQSNV